jgi:hypothetical protein
MHLFGKIISKLMANRLEPELGKLISYNQNGFIKKCCIHDNCVFVQQVIKELHTKKNPALFLKLDISKAFDTVNWSYLLDIKTFLGFGRHWQEWISMLWATSSSTFHSQIEKSCIDQGPVGGSLIPYAIPLHHGTIAHDFQVCTKFW